MKSKYKLTVLILLVVAACLTVYLVAQIIIPEPIAEKLTDLANPPHNAAKNLVDACLTGNPDQVCELLSRSCRDRIFHNAALSDTAIRPEQAMQNYTAKLHAHCTAMIRDRMFFLIPAQTLLQNRVRYTVRSGTVGKPGADVLDITVQKEEDGIWRCEQVVKLP